MGSIRGGVEIFSGRSVPISRHVFGHHEIVSRRRTELL